MYAHLGYAGHSGMDYAVPLKTPVNAAADGVVSAVKVDPDGYGLYIIVRHNFGDTLYAHLHSHKVKVGTKVAAGQCIGLSGNSGWSTGPHLHFELRVPAYPIPGYKTGARDPYPYLMAAGSGAPKPEPKPNSGKLRLRVEQAGLNIREAPTTSAPVLDQFQGGEEIEVLDIGGQDAWVQVRETANHPGGWANVQLGDSRHMEPA